MFEVDSSVGANGQIITFYSFKGGVGRTMALANVAFLAAMNGQRVLVMDWDLEAPGLSYYFRGQLDASEARSLKDAPGVLDLVWEWSSSLGSELSGGDALLKRFEAGIPFDECVRSLLSPDMLPITGALDFIGAGSRVVKTPVPKRYEEALAEFSWTQFLNENAGGIVLESLRRWSKSRYDLVLLDSRTGLADVAGICTMQLPDVVALCFIFNRQNIDGVAKVAAAIRSGRNEEVQVRAVPMRVARSGTPEETDARARATAELTRIGGFSSDSVREDFLSMSVALADSVPFYETLAPFAAQDPKLDLLTLNYTRLSVSLIGKEMEVPEIDPALIQLVRRRLLPRHATLEYLSKLKEMQPERAIEELQGLIESAFEAALNGESLDDEYVSALVDVCMSFTEITSAVAETPEIQSRTLDLLRELVDRKPSKWRALLAYSLERYIELFSYTLEREDELLLLEELDGLLAVESTTSARLRRIDFRRRAAAIYRMEANDEGTMQTVGEINQLLENIPREPPLPKDQASRVFFAEIDVELLSGNVELSKGRPENAFRRFEGALKRLKSGEVDAENDKGELGNFLYQAHSSLAAMPLGFVSELEAARHALSAAQTGRISVMVNFSRLSVAILKVPGTPTLALEFLKSTIGNSEFRAKRSFPNYYGRQVRLVEVFLESLLQLCTALAKLPITATSNTLEAVVETVTGILSSLGRRRHTVSSRSAQKLGNQADDLMHTLLALGMTREQLDPLFSAYHHFFRTAPRDTVPPEV
jgi:hypothetical protein